jgi:hypothetical protein
LRASSLTFQVSRSQVPLGVVAKTDKIDAATKKYIEEKNIPLIGSSISPIFSNPSMPNFVLILPMWFLISRADKPFAIYVVDLIDKVLGKYRIYAYAPQLFDKPTEDVTFYGRYQRCAFS